MAGAHVTITDYKTQVPGELLEGRTWRFPAIEKKTARGGISTLIIYVRCYQFEGRSPVGEPVPICPDFYGGRPLPPGIYAEIRTDSFINAGKVRKAEPTYVLAGKNIGKRNQTNAWTQALRDALSKYNKELKKATGLVKSEGGEEFVMYPPMLASVVEKATTCAGGLVSVQPKYNGVRCMACNVSGAVVMYSRGKKEYTGFEDIRYAIAEFLEPGVYLDGELYCHGMSLQKIIGEATSGRGKDLVYMIYDCYLPGSADMTFADRYKLLVKLVPSGLFLQIVPTDTFECAGLVLANEGIQARYNDFMANGYEGAILRFDYPYKPSLNGIRSKALMKLKPVHDGEYRVVGWTTGKGKNAEALVIVCETEGGSQFSVTPAMTIEYRNELAAKFAEADEESTYFDRHIKGKYIVVKYEELSEGNIPLRARTGLEIREHD